MSSFKMGDRVRVTGTVVGINTDYQWISVRFNTDRGASVIGVDLPGADIENLGPDSWPPQVGDIWEAEGTEYAVRQNLAFKGQVVIFSLEGFGADRIEYHQEAFNFFKSLSPTLVRRREHD